MSDNPLESWVESDVSLYAKSQGCLVIKLNLQGVRGWPDRLYLFKGRCLFIEFKRSGEKPRKLQEHRIGQLRQQGFTVAVVDNYADGKHHIGQFTSGGA